MAYDQKKVCYEMFTLQTCIFYSITIHTLKLINKNCFKFQIGKFGGRGGQGGYGGRGNFTTWAFHHCQCES